MKPLITNPALPSHIDTARFWAQVRIAGPDECWEWTGCKGRGGYGKFVARIQGTRQQIAHRIAWFLHHGVLPDLLVLHRCDNRPCCNPAHLFLGTNDDNMSDMASKGRASRGEQNANARLTEEGVRLIRSTCKTWSDLAPVAAKLGISMQNANVVLLGRTWKHVV